MTTVKPETPEVFYFPDDSGRKESYYFDGKLHREDAPAVIEYKVINGTEIVTYEAYWLNGVNTRLKQPTVITYYDNGAIHTETYILNGKRHRANGPAFISYDMNGVVLDQTFYKQGKELPAFKKVFNVVDVEEVSEVID